MTSSKCMYVYIFFLSLIMCSGAYSEFVPLPDDNFAPEILRGSAVSFLKNSMVLVTGGKDSQGTVVSYAALFDPAEDGGSFGKCLATSFLQVPRAYHVSTSLEDGRIVVSGGRGLDGALMTSVEVFNPQTGAFTLAGNLLSGRAKHSVVALDSNRLLFVGGKSAEGICRDLEILDLTSGESHVAGTLTTQRMSPVLSFCRKSAEVFIVGGGTDLVEVFHERDSIVEPAGKLPQSVDGGIAINEDDEGFLFLGGNDHLLRLSYAVPVIVSIPSIREKASNKPLLFPLGEKNEASVHLLSGEIVTLGARTDEEVVDSSRALTRAALAVGEFPGDVIPPSETMIRTIRCPLKWLHTILRKNDFDHSELSAVAVSLSSLMKSPNLSVDEKSYLGDVFTDIAGEAISSEIFWDFISDNDSSEDLTALSWKKLEWVLNTLENRGFSDETVHKTVLPLISSVVSDCDSLTIDDLKKLTSLRRMYPGSQNILNKVVRVFVEVLRAKIAPEGFTDAGLTRDEMNLTSIVGEVKPLVIAIRPQSQKLLVEKGIPFPVDLVEDTLPSGKRNLPKNEIYLPSFIENSHNEHMYVAKACGIGTLKVLCGECSQRLWISAVEPGMIQFNDLALASIDEGSADSEDLTGTSSEGLTSGDGETTSDVGEEYTYDEGTEEYTQEYTDDASEEYTDDASEEYTYDEGSEEYTYDEGTEEYTYDEGTEEYTQEYTDDASEEYTYDEGSEEYTYDQGTEEYTEEYVYDDGASTGEYADEGTGATDDYTDDSGEEYVYDDDGASTGEYADEGTGATDDYTDDSGEEYVYDDDGASTGEYPDEGTGATDDYTDDSGEEYVYDDDGASTGEYPDEGTDGTGSETNGGSSAGTITGIPGTVNAGNLVLQKKPVLIPTQLVKGSMLDLKRPVIGTIKPGSLSSSVAQTTLDKASTAMTKKDILTLKTCFTSDSWEHYGTLYSANTSVLPLIGEALKGVTSDRSTFSGKVGDIVTYSGTATLGSSTVTIKVFLTLDESMKWLISSL